MQKFDVQKFLHAYHLLSGFMQTVVSAKETVGHLKMSGKSDENFILENAEEISALIGELNLPLSTISANRMVNSIKTEQPLSIVTQQISDLTTRLQDEFSSRTVLIISANKTSLYESNDPLFGSEVEAKFSRASFEIDESGKCRALGRDTAAVFHLMRIMEIGIRSVAKCLGTPDPVKDADRNWGAMLRKLKEEMDRRNKAIPPQWGQPADKNFFSEIYVSLDAVRNAWRNATMHVETKYTPEEAEHIFGAVLAFMTKLASRMDESGQPAA